MGWETGWISAASKDVWTTDACYKKWYHFHMIAPCFWCAAKPTFIEPNGLQFVKWVELSTTFERRYQEWCFFLNYPLSKMVILDTLPETNSKRTWKWKVGRRLFPFGFWPICRGENVSFREGIHNLGTPVSRPFWTSRLWNYHGYFWYPCSFSGV